jgi:hypothetical protein
MMPLQGNYSLEKINNESKGIGRGALGFANKADNNAAHRKAFDAVTLQSSNPPMNGVIESLKLEIQNVFIP